MNAQAVSEAIEALLVARNPRHMAVAHSALRPGYYLRAARLLSGISGTIIVGTGFPVADTFETDGPAGAMALYGALQSLGARPVIACGTQLARALAPKYRVLELRSRNLASGQMEAREQLLALQPEAVVVIERPGLAGDDRYYNMRGEDITGACHVFDSFVSDAACPTIAIGDGGNEIGMGNIAGPLSGIDVTVSVTRCDELLVADVSNWGAYGLIAMLALCTGSDLLQAVLPEKLLQQLCERGGVDGVTRENTVTEDGQHVREGIAVMRRLRELTNFQGTERRSHSVGQWHTMDTAYLNGAYLPLDEARISPLDRGFLFGDGIYEVIPCHDGRPVGFGPHLERMQDGLDAIEIDYRLDPEEWRGIADRLVELNGGGNLALYFHISRGADSKRDHAYPEGVWPTVFAFASEIPPAPVPDKAKAVPFTVVTAEDLRWQRCNIKSTSLLGNVMHYQRGKAGGHDETILYNPQGELTEAAACNVYVIKNGVVATPLLDEQKLPGVTRRILLEILREDGSIPVEERVVTLDELRDADEVWLTSSSKEVVPVIAVDDAPVADGKIGDVWLAAQTLYSARKFDF